MERKEKIFQKPKNYKRYSTEYFIKEFPGDIDIRGEIFIQNNDFKKLDGKFANPRNAASGSLRQKNPLETKIP